MVQYGELLLSFSVLPRKNRALYLNALVAYRKCVAYLGSVFKTNHVDGGWRVQVTFLIILRCPKMFCCDLNSYRIFTSQSICFLRACLQGFTRSTNRK